jgi:pilus assembly protein CpaE
MALVVVVDSDAGFCRRMRAVFESDEHVRIDEARTTDEARPIIELRAPEVVVLGPAVPREVALPFCEAMGALHPRTEWVLVSDEVSTDLLRDAMRHGVRDVVPTSAKWAEVGEAVSAAVEAAGRQAPASLPEAAPERHGKVVTVFSMKGGVGKTVVATNLGVALARMGLRTVLVDLDLQFGDTAIMLDLKPERTIYDAVQCFDRLDADMLRGYLMPHKSGLQVLLAPVHPEDADAVTVSRAGAIVDMLRAIADVVVIDTAAAFDDIVLAAIDRSDEVYAVATMDVASIKNTRVSLQKLHQLGYDDGLARLVMNRADSKVWLDLGEVEHTIDAEVVAKVPSDRLVPRSVNRGIPVVIDAPKSPVARSLAGLARLVAAGRGEVSDSVA